MRYFFFICALLFAQTGFSQQTSISSRLEFTDVQSAKKLLLDEDAFTRSWSQFDIDSRVQKAGSAREELFNHIESQVRPWQQSDIDLIRAVAHELDSILILKGYKLPLTEKIKLVKTTMKEEGGAGAYTRSDYIVFGNAIRSMDRELLKQVFLHELFHVISRNNLEFKTDMYNIIGFTIIDPVSYPPSIKDRRITNPDAPQTDHYVELQHKGETVRCMMVLYADKPYVSGSFFEYLTIGFLKLEGDQTLLPSMKNGSAVIYAMNEVDGYFEQIGTNTQYIIHPEEVCADNFSYAILDTENLANPEIVEKIKSVLLDN